MSKILRLELACHECERGECYLTMVFEVEEGKAYLMCWGTITAFYILEGIEEVARGKCHPVWLAGSLALVFFGSTLFPERSRR